MKSQFVFKQIMLIDDNEIDNWLAETLIKKTGVAENIIIFTDATEALRHLKKSKSDNLQPDLIFLDLKIPLQDGFDFLEEYETLELPDIMLYILTVSKQAADMEKSMNFKSVKGYILKPLQEKLLNELKKIQA